MSHTFANWTLIPSICVTETELKYFDITDIAPKVQYFSSKGADVFFVCSEKCSCNTFSKGHQHVYCDVADEYIQTRAQARRILQSLLDDLDNA